MRKCIISPAGRAFRSRVACRVFSFLAAVGYIAGATSGAVAASERKEISAFDFVQMIGVGLHIRYTDGAYANVRNVMDDIKFLGISHVRDDLPGTDNRESLYARDMMKRMAFDGIKFNLCFPVRWREFGAINFLKILEMAVPGSVTTVEGYNEINNAPVTYDGQSGVAAAAAGQKAIYDAIKTDPALKHVPVIDMTGFVEMKDPTFIYGKSLKGYADLMNHHAYPQNGQQPGGWINSEKLGQYKAMEEPMPKAITEFGYSSLPQSGWLVIGVDERTQAKGILNGLFDAARSGYDKIYFYELLDQKPDPDLKELELHFGFFTFDNRPKIVARAIRNLTRILGEDGNPDASRRTPGQPVQVTVQGPDSKEQIYTLGLKKSDGRRLAAIWRETPFWDRATGQPLEATPVPTKVSFGNACKSIKLYDVLNSSEPISTSVGDSFSLNVGDYVQLVECVR